MMTDILSLPIIQMFGFTLLHFLWQGSIVGIILFVALCILRKPQMRYLASCFALLALAALPVVTFANLYETPAKVQPLVEQNDVTVTPNLANENVKLEPTPTSPRPTQNFVDKTRLTLYLPWIVLTWFVGALIFSCKLLFSFVALHRFKTKGVNLAEQTLQLKLLDFAQRLNVKQRVTLLESKLVPVPVVLGWLRPIILLPTSVVTGLSPRQLEMLLAHELAHVMRRDYLVNVLQSGLESLLFYHPVVWWVSAQIRKEREYCCDDIAVSLTGDLQQYAQTLLTLAEMRVQLAPAASGGQLFTRISRLLQPLETEMRPSYWFAGLSSLGILTFLVLTLVNVSTAQQNTPELWATVAGNVTFNEDNSQIVDMASDAYIVIEERDGSENKKVYAKLLELNSGDTLTDELGGAKITTTSEQVIPLEQIEANDDWVMGYNYSVNGETRIFDEDAKMWFETVYTLAILHRMTEAQAILPPPPPEGESQYDGYFEGQESGYNILMVLEPALGKNGTWYTTFSAADLDLWRNDITKSRILHSHGLLSDEDLAEYVDYYSLLEAFGKEVVLLMEEAVQDIHNPTIRENTQKLLDERAANAKSLKDITINALPLLPMPEYTDSPDGKNKVSGQVTWNHQAVPNAKLELTTKSQNHRVLDSVISDSEGFFVLDNVPSGSYELTLVDNELYEGYWIVEVNNQHLNFPFMAQKKFSNVNLEQTSAQISLSWDSVPETSVYRITFMKDNEPVLTRFTKDNQLSVDFLFESGIYNYYLEALSSDSQFLAQIQEVFIKK